MSFQDIEIYTIARDAAYPYVRRVCLLAPGLEAMTAHKVAHKAHPASSVGEHRSISYGAPA